MIVMMMTMMMAMTMMMVMMTINVTWGTSIMMVVIKFDSDSAGL